MLASLLQLKAKRYLKRLILVCLHANRISLVLAIHTQGPLSSTELASHIGLSRQLIESRLKQSVADGFFVSVPDERDSRKRVYDIAPKAKAEAEQIVTIMQEFEDVYDALWEEIEVNLHGAGAKKTIASYALK